jgi:hypothetical protein
MFLRGRRVLVTLLAILVCGLGVLLRVLVLADIMEVGGLEMMMGCGRMMSGGLMMMLARGMLVLRHDNLLSIRSGRFTPGSQLQLDMVSRVSVPT